MSAYSTLTITRSDAISEIMGRIMGASDEQLEEMMLDLVGHETLNSFKIVNDYDEASDRSWRERYGKYRYDK